MGSQNAPDSGTSWEVPDRQQGTGRGERKVSSGSLRIPCSDQSEERFTAETFLDQNARAKRRLRKLASKMVGHIGASRHSWVTRKDLVSRISFRVM